MSALADIAKLPGVSLIRIPELTSGEPLSPELLATLRECTRLDDTDRANGRKLLPVWSGGCDTLPNEQDRRALDDALEYGLDIRALVDTRFVLDDPNGDSPRGDEAGTVGQGHLGSHLYGKAGQGSTDSHLTVRLGSVFHRFVSWLKSLFSRGRS